MAFDRGTEHEQTGHQSYDLKDGACACRVQVRRIGAVHPTTLDGGDRETRDSSFVAQRRNEIAMSQLLRFPSSVKRDPVIEVWMHEHSGELGKIAQSWFEVMRDCGDDVRELLHDGHPTACVGDAAFAYVNAFKDHVNVGFFRGAEIADPEGLLEGTGKFMRHVKLKPERDVDATALMTLIETAYTDMMGRLKAE